MPPFFSVILQGISALSPFGNFSTITPWISSETPPQIIPWWHFYRNSSCKFSSDSSRKSYRNFSKDCFIGFLFFWNTLRRFTDDASRVFQSFILYNFLRIFPRNNFKSTCKRFFSFSRCSLKDFLKKSLPSESPTVIPWRNVAGH